MNARQARTRSQSALLTVLLLCVPFAAGAQAWKEKIDRLWADEERSEATDTCQMHVVRAMPPLLRGSISGRGCVVKAISAARDGDTKLATAWLEAGYCRNKLTRKEIKRAGKAAVEYAMDKYGRHVP